MPVAAAAREYYPSPAGSSSSEATLRAQSAGPHGAPLHGGPHGGPQGGPHAASAAFPEYTH